MIYHFAENITAGMISPSALVVRIKDINSIRLVTGDERPYDRPRERQDQVVIVVNGIEHCIEFACYGDACAAYNEICEVLNGTI